MLCRVCRYLGSLYGDGSKLTRPISNDDIPMELAPYWNFPPHCHTKSKR